MSRATTMNTYGVTLLEDVKYRSQSLCPTGVKVVNAPFKVSGITCTL